MLCAPVLVAGAFAFHSAARNTDAILSRSSLGSQGATFPAPAQLLLAAASAINAAWLSVAATIGVCVAADMLGAPSRVVLVLAIAIAALITANGVRAALTRHSTLYALTLVWSFTAVYLNQSGDAIRWTAVLAALATAAAALYAIGVTVATSMTSVSRPASASSPGAATRLTADS